MMSFGSRRKRSADTLELATKSSNKHAKSSKQSIKQSSKQAKKSLKAEPAPIKNDSDDEIDWAAEMEDVEDQSINHSDAEIDVKPPQSITQSVKTTSKKSAKKSTKKSIKNESINQSINQSMSFINQQMRTSLHEEPEWATYDSFIRLSISRSNLSIERIEQHRTNVTKYPVSINESINPSINQSEQRNSAIEQYIHHLLSKAFKDRITRLKVKLTDSMQNKANVTLIDISLNHNNQSINRSMDLGPAADLPMSNSEMCDWRTFYGPSTQLRRFRDGRIVEAVIWPAASVNQSINQSIIQTVLTRHLVGEPLTVQRDTTSLYDTLFMSRQLIDLNTNTQSINQSTNQSIDQSVSFKLSSPVTPALSTEPALVKSFTELSTVLRGLKELPLHIVGLRALHPAFRHTSVFGPEPVIGEELINQSGNQSINRSNAAYGACEVMRVDCLFETSSAWPDDINAIARIKSAFYIALHQALKNDHEIDSVVSLHHLDVQSVSGFVFRLKIVYDREHMLYERGSAPHTAYQRQHELLYKLHSSIKVQLEFKPLLSAYVRYFKRWINSQGLSVYFDNMTIDMLALALYQRRAVVDAESELTSPSMLLFRAWHELSTLKFASEPCIIHFHSDEPHADENDEKERRALFEGAWAYQKSNRPASQALFLASKPDVTGQFTSSPAITPAVLHKLSVLAKASHAWVHGLYESNALSLPGSYWLTPFKCSVMNDCAIMLTVRLDAAPLHHWQRGLSKNDVVKDEAHAAQQTKTGSRFKAPIAASKREESTLPLCGLHAMRSFCHALYTRYGYMCEIYADYEGGRQIGIKLIDDPALEQHGWTVKRSTLSMPDGSVNVAELMHEIQGLGEGIVESAQLQSTA